MCYMNWYFTCLTVVHIESICLSLCLSAPCSAFSVAQSRTPTAAFESLGLGTCPPLCPLLLPTGSLRGGGWVAGSSLPADSAETVSLAHRLVLHRGKLPPVKWALLVYLTNFFFVIWQGTECHGQKLLIRFPDNPIQAYNGTAGSPFRRWLMLFIWIILVVYCLFVRFMSVMCCVKQPAGLK